MTMLGETKCRSCSAPIVWARTDSGKAMPVDVEPDRGGHLLLERAPGGWLVRVAAKSPGEIRYRPHFATCPDAESWRRR